MQIRPFLLLIIISGIFWKAAAQDKPITKPLKTVTVTLPGGFTGTTGGGIPFDESFNLSGSATGIERIELFYRVSPFQGKRTFWFKVCPLAEKESFKVEELEGSEKMWEYVGEDGYAYIKINTKNLKPTQKKQLETGLELTIPANKTDPVTKKPQTTPLKKTLIFDGYQLICKEDAGVWEAGKISPEYYFPSLSNIGSDGYIRNPIAWEKNGDTFYLNVGPLHANVLYDFQFKVYTRPNLSDAERTKLMDELIAIVKKEYQINSVNKRDANSDKELDVRLAATVTKSFNKGGKLVDADLNHFELTHLSPAVEILKKEMFNASATASELENVLKDMAKGLADDQQPLLSSKLYLVNIKGEVDDINLPGLSAIYTLLPEATTLWGSNLQGTTVPVKAIAGILADQNKLKAILNGTQKIDATGNIVSSGGLDQQSIIYIHDFFKSIADNKFKVEIKANSTKIELFQSTGFRLFYGFFEQIKMALDASNNQLAANIIAKATTNSKGLLADSQSPIKSLLQPIVSNVPNTVSAETKALLDMALNPAIAEYKTMKVADAAMLVYNCFSNPNYFRAILSGGGVIDPTGKFIDVNPKNEISIPSVNVLLSIFRLFNSPAFTNHGAAHDLTFSTVKPDLDLIVLKLETFIKEVTQLQAKKADTETFRTEMSNQIAAAYIKKSYFLSASSIINMDVKSDKNPYVGLDLGMGYALGPQAVFISEGINIYFRPINRDVAISTFHGWDRFFKTFSIFIGITQNLSNNADETGYKSLFDATSFKSNLLFGAGYRINSLLRINGGALIYRQGSINPLISDTKVKVTPTFSIALDLDFAKLLKPFSTLF